MTAVQGIAAGTRTWIPICPYTDLIPERGAAALVRGRQVAVFRTHDDRLFAVGNRDPFSGAHVMSRGIAGTRGEEPVVAAPMHKQTFSLITGVCLDDPTTALPTYPTRVTNGTVEVSVE
ncbi:nitrite reductase small subunit NirD [Sphaerisporangium sp. TRM90804]|uniref:nitrite reductase small subunit NirD n=1 Tax=Sphaerisporangium sp. TRM90804 TaxID=3031113 RepID=UPI0024477E57|nr:nitrite reductase small subunit NirD [Sphaerisporangium sp. TRM90804]MDH2430150.1 nitrite reductase small subunit NirD [Sphaerisporangium sp. TRM90804]